MSLRPCLPPFRVVALGVLAVLACCFLTGPAAAQSQPQRVWMGMYVVDLTDIDLKTGEYTADFYLWVRTDGPRPAEGFEIMNGSGEECSPSAARRHGTLRYTAFRCRYRFHGSFDVSDYPLDEQELTVEVEDADLTERELVYVPDSANTRLDPAITIPGWRTGTPRLRVVRHAYTTLGDPTRVAGSETRYSRLVLSIPLRREGIGIYFKSFLVMFLSVGIGLLGTLLKSEHMEARLGLGVASIFGVVSSYVVVSQALPETAQFTLADQLHLVGMGFVFVSTLLAVVSYRLSERAGPERAERLDRRLGALTAAGFVAAVLLISLLH